MSESTWTRVSATEWYGRGFGTVSQRGDGWWGSNSTSATVDVEPIVGPYQTAREARFELAHAMTKWRGDQLAIEAHARAVASNHPDDHDAAADAFENAGMFVTARLARSTAHRLRAARTGESK